MLQVSGIKKKFGAVIALKDASLELAPGEIRALLGANGSGKSTLVKVLGGMVNPDGGTILLDGTLLNIKDPREARKNKIAVAYQDLSLVPQLSIAENISLGQEPRLKTKMIDHQKVRTKASELLEKLQVQENPDRLVRELDPAVQSLVEVAKALAWEPRILILDEVTASLHHDQVQQLFALLRELQKDGLAILFVSHRFDEVFSLCNTATVLRNGEMITSVNLSDVNEEECIYYMTGKRPEKAPITELVSDKLSSGRKEILALDRFNVMPKVKGISMKVWEGEIVGIAGLQGQGQGEFLRAIYGMLPFSEGSVSYLGSMKRFKSPREAVQSGIGFVSGDREREGIFPVRSVTENLFLAKLSLKRLYSWIVPEALKQGAQKEMERLNIVAGSPDHPANSLSGGNQQKLVVGRWLMINPKLLLLDDPTKGVDISARREIHSLLRQMTRNSTAIIISSSDNEELMEIADRILVLYEGRIVTELTREDTTEERLVSAMLGMECSVKGGEA